MPELYYHLTARSHNKNDFPLQKQDMWSLFEDYLYFSHWTFGLEVNAFVMMDNHFHLLCRAPQMNLGECMNYFMREVSKHISRFSQTINQNFGGPYHRSIIKNEAHYKIVYRYIYQNPLRAGLVPNVESYGYSTLQSILGQKRVIFPTQSHLFTEMRTDDYLRFLNYRLVPEKNDVIRKGLKHPEFEIFANQRTMKLYDLDDFALQ